MAAFCIPKHLVSQLKASALKGEVDVKKLYDMSSKERREFFAKYTDKVLGRLINTEFEKAIVSEQKTALLDWAKGVFDPKAKSGPVYKNVLDKINSLDEMGVLDPKTEQAFLEDLVADKLGVSVTPDEIRNIHIKAQEIQKAQESLGDNFGSVEHEKAMTDFLLAKRKMDDYLLSLNPASASQVLVGTIGRGAMLASIKSPLLNIGSNTEMAITEALARRLSGGGVKGANNKLAMDYVKMVNRIYHKTGYDLSRMIDISKEGASGSKVLGETVHSQGKGPVRATGRFFEDMVFKKLMGAPDVAFASSHFADSVNTGALKMAKGNKAKATEMMQDAMRIKPQTEAGELLRSQGIMDAEYATYTNKSAASKVSEGIRKVLNKIYPDLRIGDYTMPFVKTPSNVISAGLDYAGGGAIKAIAKTARAFSQGGIKSKEEGRAIARDFVRGGMGITGAWVITNQLKDSDFVGAYDPKRAQIEDLKNSNYNAIKVGGKWISIDWLGPLGVPVSAIMYARQYGKTPEEGVFQYGKGALSQLGNLPGIEVGVEAGKAVLDNAKSETLEEAKTGLLSYLGKEATSRLIPSILGDSAKALDDTVRDTEKSALGGLKAKIPLLSKTLPAKENVFGEPIKGEGPISDILFGSRVKTDRTDSVVTEIDRVAKELDKGVNFTDWKKSNSKQLVQFKEKKGTLNFEKARKEYGQELKKSLETLFKDKRYQKLSDDEKLSVINSKDADAMKKIFLKNRFKYQQEKKSTAGKGL